MHDAHHLGRVNLGVAPADPIHRVVNLDRMAVRGRRQDDDVGQLADPRRVIGVELDDHLVGLLQERRGVADSGGQVDPTVRGDVGRLDDREVHATEEALHDHLRDVREVHVHEVEPPGVRQLAKRTGGHVGRAPAHGLGQAELVVAGRPRRGAAEDADLERLTSLVQSPGSLGQRPRHRLGSPGRGEAAHPHHRAVGDQLRSLFGGQRRK